MVVKNMLPEVHIKAGLGSPPMLYYTNKKNIILKDEVEHKSSKLPDFVDKVRTLLEEQIHEIECALIATGEYR